MSKIQIRSLLRRAAAGSGWALCVGAGISKPAFPDWLELVNRLAKRDSLALSLEAVRHLQTTYSPDALIQAAMDRLQLTEEKFAAVLAEELYSNIKATLSKKEWTLFARALGSTHIGSMTPVMWEPFVDLIAKHFPGLTALGLATTLSKAIQSPIAPAAILSFNAEPLFPALINATVAVSRGAKGGDVLDYVVHATTDRKAGRVPFVFCHGLLPIPGTRNHSLSSVDKLVFSEAAYLQLANTSFSWQSASFLHAAGENSIVFVGVSLTDPNMRRWLSWVHATRVAELTEAGAAAPTSTVHYWIAKTPPLETTERWTESLVSHLGIRLIWVKDYADIAPTLELMIS
jgi:hypothetical protein